MRGNNLRAVWVLLLLAASGAVGGALPGMPLIKADFVAQEEGGITHAIGHVHLEQGDIVVRCDAATIWWNEQEVYLEGHVVYQSGKSVMEGERAYIRWGRVKDEATGREKTVPDRGFLYNAVVRWNERPDRVAWHVRAEEVLQTDVKRFVARGGLVMSPCQFHEPHTFFRASEVEFVSDDRIVARNLSYHARGVSLPPIWVFPAYWPYLYIPLGWEWPQVSLQVGRSGRLGTFIQSEVIYQIPDRLFGFLRSEVGVRLDYFTKRGIAYGASFAYESDDPPREGVLGRDLVRGRLEFYRVPDDKGKDYKEFELGTTDRYRVKVVHSQDLPAGLELDVEYQRYSDAGFQQEYFRREYATAKPIEERIYLKYARGPFAAYAHLRWQDQEFLDATEYLPQVGLNVFSYPLWRNLLYTGHIEVARIHRQLSELRLRPGQLPTDPAYEAVRRKWNFFFDGDPDYPILPLESTPQEFLSDGRRLWRLNTYHQLSYPFELGIFHVEPFAAYRGTYYSELLDGGSGWRSIIAYGFRASTQFWRAWDDVRIRSPLLDVQGIRHVITPEIRFLSIQKPSIRADELILTDDTDIHQPPRNAGYAFPFRPYRPYDTYALAFGDIDAIVPVRLLNLGLRNRWQTHRGGNIVDLLDIYASTTYYLDDDRDNWGRSRGDWSIDTRFSPLHGVYFFLDFGQKVCGRADGTSEQVNVARSGLAIEVSDRWALVLTQSYEEDFSNHWAIHLIYQISKKWRLDLQYDYNTEKDQGYSNELTLRLTRDLHDWIAAFTFQNDSSGLQNLIGFSLQPKGRRELIRGLEYTRDLTAGLDTHYKETYQQFDY